MKIIFRHNINVNIDKPFGIYQYDELIARNPYYIDIRGIVRGKSWIWLDEIQSSFTNVSKKFLSYTSLWWLTGMSRLDFRPWCQENYVKPLFYAMAVLEWIKVNPGVKEIFLIGCDPMVAAYLKELDNTLILEGERLDSQYIYFIFQALRRSAFAIYLMLVEAYRIAKNHAFKPLTNIKYQIIVLYELISGLPITSGYKYFYGSLFDSMSNMGENSIGYSCIEYTTGLNPKKDREEFLKNKSLFFLLDNINIGYLIIGILKNIYIILVTLIMIFTKLQCSINRDYSFWFWKNYLFHGLARITCLSEICAYFALKTLLKRSPQCKLIIYPYEEKGLERAYLFACQEQGIRTIGYTPHPQYRSAVSLRDNLSLQSPKPSRYAVCGSAYVDYFVSWGKKDRNIISVWGSEKSYRYSPETRRINQSHLKILLLISHPNELKVFYSWLRAEERLLRSVTYIVRVYKGVYNEEFEKVLTQLNNEFDCIKESNDEFEKDLRQCDLAVFCATSAGPLTVNRGYLAIYVDLNDFLDINPCFDDLDEMLPCRTSEEFAKRLDEIRKMNTDSIEYLYHKQVLLTERIFSPIQTNILKEELLC